MYAKFTDEFIAEIKDKADLVKLAKQYTQLKEVGIGIWQGTCPHPNHNDSTPSFTIWQKTNTWVCYGCHSGKKNVNGNYGSDIIAFVQWVEKLSFVKAIEFLADWCDIPLPNNKNQKEYEKNYKLAIKYHKDLYKYPDAIEYLYSRGLDDIDISEWLIGYDAFQKRITFPLFDRYKNILGFNKRILYNNDNIKYKNSSNNTIFNKSKYLYGINNLDDSINEIRITEGSMDVILAHKYGLKNVVASLGTSFTEEHAKAIYKTGKTPVLIFDKDEAGNKAVYKIIAYFEALGVYCKIVELPQDKDLADISLEMNLLIEQYVSRKSLTAGYLQINKILNEYHAALYELKLNLTPKIEETLKHVPLNEKRVLKSFIKDELRITL